MLIHCDQCHSKYKITIKKIPSKPVNFRCGKCQKNIVISPEELQKDLGTPAEAAPAASATPEPESKPLGARVPSPEQSAQPAPEPQTEASSTDTVQLTCLKCGAAFVKHKDDKARLCYQCRIDAIVSKIKDKYGVTQETELPEAKSKYTFRSPDGLILGPIRLKTVAVLVREKRLLGQEEVSKDGADFRPLAEFAELKSLFPDLQPAEPALAPAAPSGEKTASRYRFRTPEGSVLGPMKLKIAAALALENKLKGNEEVSKDGAEFQPLAELEELKKLFPELPAPAAAPEPAPGHEEEIPLDLEEFPLEPVQPAVGAQVSPPDQTFGARVTAPAKPAPTQPAKPAPAQPPEPEPVLELELEPLPDEAPAKPAPTLGARVPPPAQAQPAPAPENISRYKIRYPDGLVLGPIRLIAVEDLIAAGNLTGQEEVQKDNAGWKPFLDFPELKRLMTSGEEIAEDEVVELTDLLEEVS